MISYRISQILYFPKITTMVLLFKYIKIYIRTNPHRCRTQTLYFKSHNFKPNISKNEWKLQITSISCRIILIKCSQILHLLEITTICYIALNILKLISALIRTEAASNRNLLKVITNSSFKFFINFLILNFILQFSKKKTSWKLESIRKI